MDVRPGQNTCSINLHRWEAANLYRTHEVRQALATVRNDGFDDLLQVSRYEVDVEGGRRMCVHFGEVRGLA